MPAPLRSQLKPSIVTQRINELLQRDEMRLAHLFTDTDVHLLCERLEIDFRERDFTPAVTLGLFVQQVLSRADACSTMLAKFNRERKQQGLRPVCEDASAYCKARSRLPIELIHALNDRILKIINDRCPNDFRWKQRDVFFVDGFVLLAPDTLANQEVYPQPSSQKEGLGFPQVRVVVITSLTSGCITQYKTAQVIGKETGENSLFREIQRDFEAGAIVVGDSNFDSFHDSALLRAQGVDVVFGINGTRNSPFEGVCETIDDTTKTIPKPKFNPSRFTYERWETLPESIEYRIIRYRVSGRKDEITIVTTLLENSSYSATEIAELYGLRWDVEIDIGCFKTTMGQCRLRCHTPENLEREIAVSVLGYNLVRVLMNDAARVIGLHPRELSFSHARDAWLNFSDETETAQDMMWIVLSAASQFVRDRPGRQEPRAVKARRAKYARLTEHSVPAVPSDLPMRGNRPKTPADPHKSTLFDFMPTGRHLTATSLSL